MTRPSQENAWENEYKNKKLVTGSQEPQTSFKDFLRWLRRDQGIELENLKVLDLGCGNGKNSNYLANLDENNNIIAIDISDTALNDARIQASKMGVYKQIKYYKRSIGRQFEIGDCELDLILDITSSNSLSESERKIYLEECSRTLKSGGYLFVRALCKDGDKNAQNLLKLCPGNEHDTCVLPNVNIKERVFSKDDFINTYSPFFEMVELEKETHYTKLEGRLYKRNFWIAYLRKTKL